MIIATLRDRFLLKKSTHTWQAKPWRPVVSVCWRTNWAFDVVPI